MQEHKCITKKASQHLLSDEWLAEALITSALSLCLSRICLATRGHMSPRAYIQSPSIYKTQALKGKLSMTPRCWLVIVIKRKKNLPLIFKICLYIFSVITASSLLIIFLFYFGSRCQPWSSKCFKSINQVK